MNNFLRLFCLSALTLVLYSCKGEVKNDSQKTEEPVKKELTEKEKKQINSVMTKAMMTAEIKTFVGTIITSGLADKLAKEEGPFTILAPSNEAFGKIDTKEMKALLNPKNKEQLIKLTNGHIVNGRLDSATLVQNIKDDNGSYNIRTWSGAIYIATQEGADIVITDGSGAKALIGKSDINGSNGVLHILDNVLSRN